LTSGVRALRPWLHGVAGSIALDRACVALAAIALAIAVFLLQVPRVELISRVSVSQPGTLLLYYSADGMFSEFRAQAWPLAASVEQEVALSFPADQSAVLRLDPPPGIEQMKFCATRLVMPDGTERALGIDRFAARNEIGVSPSSDCVVITSSTTSVDPQLGIDLSPLQDQLRHSERKRKILAVVLVLFGASMLLAAGGLVRWTGRLQAREVELLALTAKLPAIYLVLGLVIGGLFCVVTPPGGVPDEPAHLAKTILVENGEWMGRASPDDLEPGLGAVLGPFGDYLNPAKRFNVSEVIDHAARPIQCTSSQEVYPSSATNYSPTMYVPGAYVLSWACSVQAPTGAFVYGGRFANLLVSLVLVFLGLRAAGRHAWPLFAVAMLPMMLFEQASFTADSLVLSLSLCIVGVQVGVATSQVRLGALSEAALLALGLALALSKPGYAWVCVGFLFCSRAYQSSGRSFWPKALLLVALPWLVHVVWVLVSAEGAVARAGVDPKANLSLFFSEPRAAIGQWYRTFIGEGSVFLWSSLVGRLGWLDVILHPGAYALAATALIASMGMRGDAVQPIPDWRTRSVAFLFAAGSLLLPALPMYLFWTPAGALVIEGLQGRYFLPSVAFFMAWLSFRTPGWWRGAAGMFVLCAAIAINLDALFRTVQRFYG
jgi:uncharacterized membrane protein